MIYQKNIIVPRIFYTSNNITGPPDRVILSTYGMIMRLIIFDKFVQDQEKIKFARMTHTYLETDLITMRQKK
jgi:hypothetical protein